MNKTIAMYLRCVTGDRPRSWLDWLAWAEYFYNTSYHSALRTAPFQVVYGRPPPALPPCQPGAAQTETVNALLMDRDMFLADVRSRLLQAQEYGRYYDTHHRDIEYNTSDWVWLRLLHRPTQSLVPGRCTKLSPLYAGPFQVIERIGAVAYRLQLPEGAHIHDVFHVGILKPFHGAPPAAVPPLPPLQHGRVLPQPERVLGSRQRRGDWHVLVQWAGMPAEEATWELVTALRAAYPSFQLEDEMFVDGGRDVVHVYMRRERGN